jgi:Cu(I)/Ag(I) efflux system membrane fusion protein
MLKGADHTEHLPDYTSISPLAFKQQLAEVANNYLSLKDAFVATDVQVAGEQAGKLTASLGKVDMSLLDGDAHLYWMEQLSAMELILPKLKHQMI